MNLKQANTIGFGALFPIILSTPKDKDGNDEYTDIIVNGVVQRVKKMGWYPTGGIDLVKNNLQAIFVYQIGEKFRQENFGSRLWECIEEPNTDVLSYMVSKFVKEAIAIWESRVIGLSVSCIREGSKLLIRIEYALSISAAPIETIIEYDHLTNSTYAY